MSNRDLSQLSDAELYKLELAVARRHIGRFPLLAVVWAFLNLAVWLSLWPLVLFGVMPLWLGLIIATVNAALGYLPSHEAQHDIIARPGSRLFWLNELVGHVSTIPLALPYRVAKVTHQEHHKHTNLTSTPTGRHAPTGPGMRSGGLSRIASLVAMAHSMPMAAPSYG